MPAPTLREYKAPLYMMEIDIHVRMLSQREFAEFRRECKDEYAK
jgi:hypothetical protein